MTYEVFLKDLGFKLKQQRKYLGLKQSQLVEKINSGLEKNDDDYLSDKQLSRVECGKSATRLDKFIKLSLALEKTPDYFLLGIDHGDDNKDGKILQICGCLKNCSNEDIDTVLMLVRGMNAKNQNIK
ncbi:MAG: helix-turn-helix domain-containing protein [Acetobacter sp.]|nr:helix-turn-helix domain-containing protein [Bacteroides sp.]MCM1341799.1 helix-turn-helix domain-containing protein [Acetobacter sp.]MCM1433141.1 helix-turn-helix domain-containing protein [Clostridiales bacterium]